MCIRDRLNEYRGWRKVEKLIGCLDDTTLNKQHNEIKENISDKTEGIKTKVDRMDTMLIRNEERYLNLNSDQKEIRNNINKFLYDWEGMRLKIDVYKRQALNRRVLYGYIHLMAFTVCLPVVCVWQRPNKQG